MKRHVGSGSRRRTCCVNARARPQRRSADEIVIGASLPLSGPLAGFGSFQQWGYKRAVEEVNKAGGIAIDGNKQQVKLVIRDDKTDPNATASNTETLISRDHVVAMLGSCTPALVNAGALVAERAKKPIVTGCDPLEAFKSVRKWNYVWDIFFHEPELAAAQFKAMAELGAKTNKKVAIWHDNGPDGQVVGGKIWPALAKEFGYEVVQNAEFPIDNSQFTSIIGEAKSKGAEVVLVDAITPQAIAIRKQMASAGYTPKVLNIEKGAEPVQFAEALGKLSDGVLVGGYWDPDIPLSWRGRPRQGIRERDEADAAASISPIPTRLRRSCSTPSPPRVRPIPRRSTPPSPRPTRPMSSARSSSTRTTPQSFRSSRCSGRAARP